MYFNKLKGMTKDHFLYLIEIQKPLEFSYNGKIYNMTYDKKENGELVIVFGKLYEGKRYDSVGQLLNTAKIENHFFKDMLDII